MKEHEIRKVVREGYGRAARRCCGPVQSSEEKGLKVEVCCSEEDIKGMGYTEDDLRSIPEGSNLGLGCGNPVALASLKEGETVLDLGSGAGVDCFLAAKKVGDSGKVIGVDMTPEMLERARENADKGGYKNVDFRLGEIEYLPVADNSVDVVISNCVINLSPDKKQVFEEAYRVLKPGGRVMISDMVLTKELPEFMKKSKEAYVSCIGGAIKKEEYIRLMGEAGFTNVSILEENPVQAEFSADDPTIQEAVKRLNISLEKMVEALSSIVSMKVRGEKPA